MSAFYCVTVETLIRTQFWLFQDFVTKGVWERFCDDSFVKQCLYAQLNIEFPLKRTAKFPLSRQGWAVKSVSLKEHLTLIYWRLSNNHFVQFCTLQSVEYCEFGPKGVPSPIRVSWNIQKNSKRLNKVGSSSNEPVTQHVSGAWRIFAWQVNSFPDCYCLEFSQELSSVV